MSNSNYMIWKGWSCETFGSLNKNEKSMFDAEFRRVKRSFPANTNVLEIGFGNGAFLTYGKLRSWRMTGVEINDDLVHLAKNKGFISLNLDSISTLRSHQFDLVVAFDVLEHIPQDRIIPFVSEIKKYMKVGGIFVARFPNGDSPFGLYLQNADITHANSIGSEKIKFVADNLNFKILYIGGAAQPIFNVGLARALQRIMAWPIKKSINLFVRLFFFPKAKIDFSSPNLVVIFES